MRHGSHTFIGHLRDAIEAWRKANGWSRETVVQAIVEAHEQIGGPSGTGIVFDPPTRDTFERAKVNADRVFRWLDDVTKDGNTCPANFLPSILAALPLDRRIGLLNHWLLPVDVACRPLPTSATPADTTVAVFQHLIREAADAQAAMAPLIDGIAPGELKDAHTELCQALIATQRAIDLTERKLAEAQP